MSYYVGLDVSLKTVFICIVNAKGKVVREDAVESKPEEISSYLKQTGYEITQIGLESGNLTHYLKKGLQKAGYDVVVMEARKMAAILATIINKTDKNDARGIAEALRVGHFRECVHRSDEAMEIRSVLHMRQTLVEEKTHVVNSLKGHLKVYGIKLTKKAGKNFRLQVEEAVKELSPKVQRVIKSLLNVMDSLNTEIKALDKEIEELAKNDEDVQLLQTIDGVGPITALSFKAEIDDIRRFKDSRNVAAYLGLTPSQYSSGETKKQGGISKKGSKRTRYLLVEAATVLLTRCKTWSKLKAWGMKLMKKKGKKKAIVAVARKLAVIMHKMLESKKPFERTDEKEKIAA